MSTQNKHNWLKMHNISLSFNKSLLIYMEIISNFHICRTNNVPVSPCKKNLPYVAAGDALVMTLPQHDAMQCDAMQWEKLFG